MKTIPATSPPGREQSWRRIQPDICLPHSGRDSSCKKLLKKYPDSKEFYEYEDYLAKPTRENAEELLQRILETHGDALGSRENYVSYIAGRPGVEKTGAHGLFTDEGVPVVLPQVAKEMAESQSNIWTHIISLRREDAERLGYNTAEAWMQLLRSQRNRIARQMKIAPENFRWYAAFHNAGHHPHVHMMAYSIDPKEAYLTTQGIAEIKSGLAREIFSPGPDQRLPETDRVPGCAAAAGQGKPV